MRGTSARHSSYPGRDRPDLFLTIRAGEVAMARRTSPPLHAGSCRGGPSPCARGPSCLGATIFGVGRITASCIPVGRRTRRSRGRPSCRRRWACGLAADGEFPPGLLAHGLHMHPRRGVEDAGEYGGEVPERGRGDRVHPRVDPGGREDPHRRHDLRRRVHLPEVPRHHGRAQVDHSGAERGPLPRRPRLRRPGGLPRREGILGRPGRGVRG